MLSEGLLMIVRTSRVVRLAAMAALSSLLAGSGACAADAPAPNLAAKPNISGIYPNLAMFNNEGECGTGAVVPWAGKLWVITYAPHQPKGSSDKLYEISPDLEQTIRPESIGGTPANRMIHRESNQLFIGPYAVAADGAVRAIPYAKMPGRHTANARHLTDPAGKIYYLTMEEGVYEVDVKTLDVKMLFPDGNGTKEMGGSLLPGYHGKGAYSGQGRLIYANNGENSAAARQRPDVDSGVLAEWDGTNPWKVILRNQFTDVTGPGGIYGNPNPATDPIWSIGWDHRSLILKVLDAGAWHTYRLPKGSHSYDGAHGWNTEWPRIRDIGEANLLMTMHGTFWHFPKTFSTKSASGIRPRSNYVKVIGDFARWGDKVVFGCDDAAKSEFLNKRKAKGEVAGPGQSQSNLWFVSPDQIDSFGPAIGRGAVFFAEATAAGKWSDPYMLAGYAKRGLHLSHTGAATLTFDLEIDAKGDGTWTAAKSIAVPAGGYQFVDLSDLAGEWVRVGTKEAGTGVTAEFIYANADTRAVSADAIFNGLATAGDAKNVGGLVRARGEGKKTLHLAAMAIDGKAVSDIGYYELDGDLKLRKVDDAQAHTYVTKNVAIPTAEGVLAVDAASVVYTDDKGKRWRLPKGDAALDDVTGVGLSRISREVATERDLFNAHGTFYELPAENAGGFRGVRPVATHNRRVHDYCSFRGLTIITGIAGGEGNPHIIRSDDGKAALWAGAVDDLWKLGKPVGNGGPWKQTAVKAGQPSDPYLMTGYDAKKLTLSQTGAPAAKLRVEVDLTGTGVWAAYQTFDVADGKSVEHTFPAAFNAYWVRVVSDVDCTATAQLEYR
jgi:hypothetical protein